MSYGTGLPALSSTAFFRAWNDQIHPEPIDWVAYEMRRHADAAKNGYHGEYEVWEWEDDESADGVSEIWLGADGEGYTGDYEVWEWADGEWLGADGEGYTGDYELWEWETDDWDPEANVVGTWVDDDTEPLHRPEPDSDLCTCGLTQEGCAIVRHMNELFHMPRCMRGLEGFYREWDDAKQPSAAWLADKEYQYHLLSKKLAMGWETWPVEDVAEVEPLDEEDMDEEEYCAGWTGEKTRYPTEEEVCEAQEQADQEYMEALRAPGWN